MPRSVVFIPTSENITYTTQQEAISKTELDIIGNQDKFLKNVNGTMEWVSIPPQPKFTLPLLALESGRYWMYSFSNRHAVYTSNLLTSLPAYGGGFAPVSMGTSIALHSDVRACQTTQNTASSWVEINNGNPTTINYCIAFLVKPTASSNGYVSQFCRSTENGIQNSTYIAMQKTNSTTWNITFKYWHNTVGNIPHEVQCNLPTSTFDAGNVYLLTFSVYGNAGHIRLNGKEVTYSSQTAYSRTVTPGNLVLFSPTPNTSSPLNVPNMATFCAALIENVDLAMVQKIEGCIKWDTFYADITPALDAAHPYVSTAPTL